MTTTKHTPGPWTKANRLNGPWWHISAETSGLGPGQGRQAVACVHGESKRGATRYAEMFEANARLISTTPELLELLQAAEVLFACHCKDSTSLAWLEKTSATLAKAIGSAQRCPLCGYEHGHAIGCENNPLDISLEAIGSAS